MELTEEKIAQINVFLEENFFKFLPKRTDKATKQWNEIQHTKDRWSRSLAAYALCDVTGISEEEAASCVIDGMEDNGIDAICYNPDSKELIIVQAKYKPRASPSQSEALTFKKGVEDLSNRVFDNFNEAFQLYLPEILDAFSESDLKVKLVFAHLGGPLQRFPSKVIKTLVDELNKHNKRVSFIDLDGEALYESLSSSYIETPIDDQIELHYWTISEPTPRIMYGQVSAQQLASLYTTYGKTLFSKNIRNFVGSTDVNNAICTTILESPELLIHYNNGISIVCSQFAPRMGAGADCGIHDLKGLSIVNGAQTVGSIAKAGEEVDLASSPAKVMITVIESSGETTFENRVTQTRNTQNRVRATDFAAQDKNQERLRREMAVSGIEYTYKLSDQPVNAEYSKVMFEEASFALACFSGRISDIVIARRSSGQLRDPSSREYKQLFTNDLTGVNLFRKIQILRLLNQFADGSEKASSPRSAERLFYRHMRFFVFHFIEQQHPQLIDNSELDLSEDDRQEFSRLFNEYAVLIQEVGDSFLSEFQGGYLALSKNQTALQQMADRVQQRFNKRGQ